MSSIQSVVKWYWWWREDHKFLRGITVALWLAIVGWIAWPPRSWPLLLPLALAPMVQYVQSASVRRGTVAAFGGMLGWNLLTTFWIRHATLPGALFATTANALIFSIPWWGLAVSKKVFRPRFGFGAFVIMWLVWERFHFQWELAWPWLTLGNVFSVRPEMVQWYAYTGVLGGTLWVWWITYQLISLTKNLNSIRSVWKWVGLGMVLIIPWSISMWLLRVPLPTEGDVMVGCIQPNINPYEEKFDPATQTRQMDTLLSLSSRAYRRGARVIIWPETSIPGVIPEHSPNDNPYFRQAATWLYRHPDAHLIAGAVTSKVYHAEEPPTPSARPAGPGQYIDYYNSVITLSPKRSFQIYHKHKLVPGVEWLPYPHMLSVLRPLMANLGGVTGAYGREGPMWPLWVDSISIAPAICYESVFGDFLRTFVSDGASLLTVVTNDGWWEATDGHRQHFHYARLRAVELGRSVARAANTGISAAFDPRGRIIDSLAYDTVGIVVAKLPLHRHITYYVYAGDVIGRMANFLFWIILVLAISKHYVVNMKNFPYIR